MPSSRYDRVADLIPQRRILSRDNWQSAFAKTLMPTLSSTILTDFHREFGPAWEADVAELAAEHGDAYLVSGLANLARAELANSQIRSALPRLVVHVVVIPKAESRMFTYWRKSSPCEYVLGIHLGTFPNVRDTLNVQDLVKEVPRPWVVLNRLRDADVLRLATYVITRAILFHEIAHIVRGHFPYLDRIKTEARTDSNAQRALCEVDADKWSSYVLAGDLWTHAKNLALQASIPLEIAVQELLAFTASCLYRWYAHFNTSVFTAPTCYPHPLLRALRIAIGAADNIDRGETPPELALARASAALGGLSAGEIVVGRLTWPPQRDFDLGAEVIAFDVKYSSALTKLSRDLVTAAKLCGLNAP